MLSAILKPNSPENTTITYGRPHREEETRTTYSRMTASRQQPALSSLAE